LQLKYNSFVISLFLEPPPQPLQPTKKKRLPTLAERYRRQPDKRRKTKMKFVEIPVDCISISIVPNNPAQILNGKDILSENIVKQLSNGHALVKIKKIRISGYCVDCIKNLNELDESVGFRRKLPKIFTHCPGCKGGNWICENCFDAVHNVTDLFHLDINDQKLQTDTFIAH
jgi:hypothetical protein